jgi:predicted membrane protein
MRKTTTEIIIVVILWVSIITSVIINPQFRVPFIFGILSATIVSITLLFRKKDESLGILIFALILSSFNAVNFSEAFGASFWFLSLFPFLLLVILIFTRISELMELKEKWFGAEPTEVGKPKENRIVIYKREFQNLSSEELTRKINNDKLVEEAKIALNQILEERELT